MPRDCLELLPLAAPKQSDLSGLGSKWHIIARDETLYAPVQIGDFVEYWHRGDFQIRYPGTAMVLPERKQIFLRVTGKYPDYKYLRYIDTTRVDWDSPPFWETRVGSLEDPGRDYYPARDTFVER